MKYLYYILIVCLIGTFFLQSGCKRKDRWKAVPLKITKRESFNYSEMISGDLDSAKKVGWRLQRKKLHKKWKVIQNEKVTVPLKVIPKRPL